VGASAFRFLARLRFGLLGSEPCSGLNEHRRHAAEARRRHFCSTARTGRSQPVATESWLDPISLVCLPEGRLSGPTIQSGSLRRSWHLGRRPCGRRRLADRGPRPRRFPAVTDSGLRRCPPWLPCLAPCGAGPLRDLDLAVHGSASQQPAAKSGEPRSAIRSSSLPARLAPRRPGRLASRNSAANDRFCACASLRTALCVFSSTASQSSLSDRSASSRGCPPDLSVQSSIAVTKLYIRAAKKCLAVFFSFPHFFPPQKPQAR
jgi:hypothetical protein